MDPTAATILAFAAVFCPVRISSVLVKAKYDCAAVMRGDLMHGDPRVGVWGKPSSELNFCELDYAITSYLAEFVNTLTNIAYVFFALGPLHTSPRDFMAVSLVAVGITSGFYHATLLQPAQFADDISMLVLVGSLLQPLYTVGLSPSAARRVSLVLWFAVTTFSAFYIYSGDHRIHRNAFTLMVTLVWPRTLYLIHYVADRKTAEKDRLQGLFRRAVLALVAAFIIWSVDVHYCLELREIREHIGLPWGWLLELHGWWHILTAVGAAEYIKLVRAVS